MKIADFTERLSATPLAGLVEASPWSVTSNLEQLIAAAITSLPSTYRVIGQQAVHERATIEEGATLKGSLIIGALCLVAGTSYLRGGVFMDEACIVGPGAELKSTVMLQGSKLAHLNFVGDSVVGQGVNIEAGAVIANYRNEWPDRPIRFIYEGAVIETGVDKFGAILGDGARIGANAVIAPGAALARGAIVPRLALVDMA